MRFNQVVNSLIVTTPDEAPIFGQRLKQARLKMALSQKQLGEKIGLEESAAARISRYESGTHEPPVRTARDLADALKVPLGYLYCDNDHLAEVILLAGGLSDEQLKKLATLIKDIDSHKAE